MTDMANDATTAVAAPALAPRVLTAAEKRAARRARVLESGDRRMKLVSGEIGSLSRPNEEETMDRALDEGVQELLGGELSASDDVVADSDGNNLSDTPTVAIPARVDPAQRRRDAAARRQRKEAQVAQLLGSEAPRAASVDAAASPLPDTNEPPLVLQKEMTASGTKAEPAFSRHTIALRLRNAEEKLIIGVILAVAVYLGVTMDFRDITTDVLTSNPLFLSYEQLVSKGVPLDSIRQQMTRENLDPVVVQQIERLFTLQRKAETTNVSMAGSFFPNVFDIPTYFTSLFYHPPIIVCVLLLRVVVSVMGNAIHSAFKLPDVKNPQEDDLGFVLNLVFSSRPALKGYIAKSRKSVDDLFFFVWSLVLVVAVRAIAFPIQ